jgi:hypothetical protein
MEMSTPDFSHRVVTPGKTAWQPGCEVLEGGGPQSAMCNHQHL